MLRPYALPHAPKKRHSGFPLSTWIIDNSRARKIWHCVILSTILSIATSDFFCSPFEQGFAKARRLCTTFFLGDFSADPYWENSFPANVHHDGGPRTLPSENNTIGFVVTLDACPEDTSYQTAVYSNDPGHALYDAAAVLKHAIDKNLARDGKYTAVMHAIVHPDAVVCANPTGEPYDRVTVLESLGYYATIRGSPLVPILQEQSDDAIIVQTNETILASDAGDRDLTKLFAGSDIDSQDAVGKYTSKYVTTKELFAGHVQS